MKIKPVEDIIRALSPNKQVIRNFPKSTVFPFEKLYRDLVSQIKTTEISSECILFDSTQAVNETKELSDPAYWQNDYTKEMISNFWIFGQNGQGDLWLFDAENNVYFYNHDLGEMTASNFTPLDLNFEKWLQFANLNKQLDDIFDTENEISEKHSITYKNKLNEISYALLDKYPFEI